MVSIITNEQHLIKIHNTEWIKKLSIQTNAIGKLVI